MLFQLSTRGFTRGLPLPTLEPQFQLSTRGSHFLDLDKKILPTLGAVPVPLVDFLDLGLLHLIRRVAGTPVGLAGDRAEMRQRPLGRADVVDAGGIRREI